MWTDLCVQWPVKINWRQEESNVLRLTSGSLNAHAWRKQSLETLVGEAEYFLQNKKKKEDSISSYFKFSFTYYYFYLEFFISFIFRLRATKYGTLPIKYITIVLLNETKQRF